MRNYPITTKTTHELRPVEDGAIEAISPLATSGFFSFR